MITAKTYLEQKLKNCSYYELSDSDKKFLSEKKEEEFIYYKLVSKKYRKWSLPDDSNLNEIVNACVKDNKPIKMVYPFGCYKLWRLPVDSEIDWAEFFAISYICEWIAPILAIYKPGIDFTFSSDDVIVERMNNISKKIVDNNVKKFIKLLEIFQKYTKNNLSLNLQRIGDLYDKQEFEEELKTSFINETKKHETYSDQKKIPLLKSSELNICWNGEEDWKKLSEEEKKDKIKRGAILHHAYTSLEKRAKFTRALDKIVVFTTPLTRPNNIAIGTTKNSVTKFWTGIGVLEKHGEKFKDTILPPKQIENIDKEVVTEKINLLSMKNFKEIKIINI